MLERIGEQIKTNVGASKVFGDSYEHDGTMVIPVARVQWGFGGGDRGEGTGRHGGGGGGARATPIGFIEIRGGRAEYTAIPDPQTRLVLVIGAVASAGLLLAGLSFVGKRLKRHEEAGF